MAPVLQSDRRPVTEAIVSAIPVEGVHPGDRLAGLSLALRTVLTLQKEGIERVTLVVPPGDEDTAAAVAEDVRTRLELRTVQAASVSDALNDLGAPLTRPVLLASHDVVVNPEIYKRLMAAGTEGAARVVAVRGGEPVGPALLRRPADPDLLDAAADELEVGALWSARVTTPEGRALAFRELFEACRKPMDGVVSRRLNRHISIFISKRIIGTPITPNMMSVFTFALAAAAAFSAWRGGYWSWLLAAFLLQWNSILDGVDGELARVRFQHSKLGQWLDTVSDDVSNWMFYAGLSLSAQALPYGEWLALAGWIGIGTHMVATAQYYAEMIRVGSGDLYAIDWGFDKEPPKGFGGQLLVFWRNVLKRDFALFFFLVVALFGGLPYVLPIVAAGSIGTLIAATMRNVKKRRQLEKQAA